MIKIKLNTEKLLRSASRLTESVEKQKTNLIMSMADEYAFNLIDNISGQKYKFVPYSEHYVEWKAEAYGHLDFWRASGDLLKAIESTKVYDNKNKTEYFSGVQGGEAQYGILVETGDGESMAGPRPLFGYTYRDFMESFAEKAMANSLEEIGRSWA